MPIIPRSVVIHGHFYQPPREDPWSGAIEAQPSAAPFHDWNTRVERECYRAVVAARIQGRGGRIRAIRNTLRHLSFNFGPTLLTWMESAAPDTYRAILEADGFSRRALGGHGNAMAQAYHHAILPLATRRDKVTEVRWGMADFRRRFQREPAGMWLPETAVDAETLDVLAQEGIAFTVLAPHQVSPLPRGGMPGLYRTPSGRTLALFVYDGPLSHDVAFGPLLKDSAEWVQRMTEERMTGKGGGDRLISLATDGESYGHHHRFGEMALALVLDTLRQRPDLRVENFSSFLARNPPEEEVSLIEPSSWSCSHGVERWRADCGCKMAPELMTQQRWRRGLRDAMEWLAGEIHGVFQEWMAGLGVDPWAIRNDYGRVVAGTQSLDVFLSSHLSENTPARDRDRAARLLELERNALRLFTSCGWFFDDLAGIEPLQILRYAARALEGLEGETPGVRDGFLTRLARAESNESPPRDGAAIFSDEERARTIRNRWFPRARETGELPQNPTLPQQMETALVEAVESLRGWEEPVRSASGDALEDRVRKVRDLAFLHTQGKIPIPFDAQTIFYRILENATGPVRDAISSLREPLGFVPD